MFMGYCGHYQVLTSAQCCEKVQVKRHRKRRINKKWLKRYGVKWVPSKKVFMLENPPRLIMHPVMYAALAKEAMKPGEPKRREEVVALYGEGEK